MIAELRLDRALNLHTQPPDAVRSSHARIFALWSASVSAANIPAGRREAKRGCNAAKGGRAEETGRPGARPYQVQAYLANFAGGEHDVVELLDHLARAKLTEGAAGLAGGAGPADQPP